MTALRSLGSLPEDSGWTAALTEARVASVGTADSFLSAASVTKTRHAHQVTACSVYKLLQSAYSAYCTDVEEMADPTDTRSFEDWCEHRKLQGPQFRYWHLVLTNGISHSGIHQVAEGIQLQSLPPADPIHVCKQQCELRTVAANTPHRYDDLGAAPPKIAEAFHAGKFVVHKSDRDF